MKIEQKVQVFITSKNKKYYSEKGYNPKVKHFLDVSPEDLPCQSHVVEERICDECNKLYKKQHREMERSYKLFGKDVCLRCSNSPEYQKKSIDKQRQTNLKKYNVEWTQQNKEIKEKSISTVREKYGCDNVIFVEKIKNKQTATNLKKYGVKNIFESEEMRKKASKTLEGKIGVENPFFSEQIQSDIRKNNLEKFGVGYPFQSAEIQKKAKEAYIKGDKVPVSKPQIQLYNTIKRLYPDCQVCLNYPFLVFSLDIMIFFEKENIKIDIEYDGNYWHQDEQKDRRRDEKIKAEGMKVLRVKSDGKLPHDDVIKQHINSLLNSQKTFSKIKV